MPDQAVEVNAITGLVSYFEHIDWSDPWLWSVIAFHFIVGISTCVSIVLKCHTVQVVLFCCYLMLVYCTEYINEWAAENYKLFSREQYFDDKGLFISILLSAPLLINSLVYVFVWMYDAYQMLIRVQKAKLKYKTTKQKESEEKKEGEDRVKDWLNKKDE